jgi:hypothetical protein
MNTPYLTDPNPILATQIRASHPGMAHFAGTGPRGQTCRYCIFWTGCGDLVRYSTEFGTPKPRRCEKFRQLMNGRRGDKVPHDARACRHFEHIRVSSTSVEEEPAVTTANHERYDCE